MPDLFTFHRDECEDVLSSAERHLIACPFKQTADEIHSAVDYAQELGAITGPSSGKISVYPNSLDDPLPILVVCDQSGLVLMGNEIDRPDDALAEDEYTCEMLGRMVSAANGLLLELRLRTHPPSSAHQPIHCANCGSQETETMRGGARHPYFCRNCATPFNEPPTLAYVYSGPAIRLHGGGDTRPVESIAGAFRVLCWLPVAGAIVGNGESPEGIWATAGNPERA